MVIPKPNLCPESQDAMREISEGTSNAGQAKRVLRQYIIKSLIKLRVREQLYFLKTCIGENLTTQRIWKVTERLNLQSSQSRTLRKTMMKNLRKELYQKMARITREMRQIEVEIRTLIPREDFTTMKRYEQLELNYARAQLRSHYRNRYAWIKKKTNERRTESLPCEIDGVVMEDRSLGDQFEAKVRQYGGVQLDEDEMEALKMQPNFAVYEEVNDLEFMANTEKTFNSLRWSENCRSKSTTSTTGGDRSNEPDIDNRDEPSELDIENQDEPNNNRRNERSENAEPEPKPFFDEKSKTFDATNLRNGDIPFRKRIAIPECAEMTTEAKLTLCRERLNEVLKNYKENEMSKKTNLTTQQRRGLEKLKKRVKNKEIVCFKTDKSGSMSVDTPSNYIESMKPHLEGTIQSTEEEYEKTEKLLNAHMQTWCRIVKMEKRVAQDFITENNEIPPLYGLRKDHKEIPAGEEEKGPPQRPVCGAVVASNYRLSHFVSSILQPVIQQAKHPCTSTEDMLSRVKVVNETVNLERCIIGSMDVKALYPSIDIDFATEKCVEMIQKSEINFKNVNTEELGLYLSLTMSEKELEEAGIRKHCAKRKRSGKKPTITGCGMKEKENERWECWRKPEQTPGEEGIKKMVSIALGVAMRTILKNHIFKFNDEIRKQASGGAIGVKAAGDIAALFMTWWDGEFLRRVNEVLRGMNLYLRYVDDEYVICEIVPESDENRGQAEDERTMKRLQEIGNQIHPSIQMTVDYPTNNQNKRMPVLDTEHWMEEVEVDGVRKKQVLHSHYAKPMANPFVVHKNSAISEKNKQSILVADLTRVMRNVSAKCTEQERINKIQHFISRMQYSGYGMEERIKIYKAAKRRYNEMVRKDATGETPMYRARDWNREERVRLKELKKRTWYKGGKEDSEAVFFVKATPEGRLAERCRKEFKRAGLKVKVIERTGKSVKSSLVKSNPFKKPGCNKESCTVCKMDKGIDCKARGVHYQISCEDERCRDTKYEGETARSTGERFEEHLRLIRDKREEFRQKSVMYKHAWERHGGAVPPMKFEILGKFPDDPAMRQATEAVSIRCNKPSLNNKMEWTNEPKPRSTKESRGAPRSALERRGATQEPGVTSNAF